MTYKLPGKDDAGEDIQCIIRKSDGASIPKDPDPVRLAPDKLPQGGEI